MNRLLPASGLLVLAAACVTAQAPGAAPKLTLKDAETLALKNHPQVQAAATDLPGIPTSRHRSALRVLSGGCGRRDWLRGQSTGTHRGGIPLDFASVRPLRPGHFN